VRSRPPLSPNATLRWSVVRTIIDEIKPRRVLEVGCGLGGFGARIAPRADYVGVESDERSYEVARARIQPLGGRVVHGTTNLVDRRELFDLVCAFEVVEHIDDDVGALADWISRLAPGGAVVVSVPSGPERFGPADELAGHYRRYTPGQLDSVLLKAGCPEVRHVFYGWPLGYAAEWSRNRIAERRGPVGEGSMSERTARSGRHLQPNRAAGWAVRVAAAPFVVMQRLRPTVGTGLIGVGRAPGTPGSRDVS
jgi:SAM-dependent methyltransferase